MAGVILLAVDSPASAPPGVSSHAPSLSDSQA